MPNTIFPYTEEETVQFSTGEDSVVILSSSNVILGDKSQMQGDFMGKNLYVYAEEIALSGTLKAKSVTMVAQRFLFSDGVISVSGRDGEDLMPDMQNGAPAKGNPGMDGGQIFLLATNQEPNTFQVQLKATGGKGGKGQPYTNGTNPGTGAYLPGKLMIEAVKDNRTPQAETVQIYGGDGGDGGNGGNVIVLLGTPLRQVCQQIQSVMTEGTSLREKVSCYTKLLEKQNLPEGIQAGLQNAVSALEQLHSANDEQIKQIDDTLRLVLLSALADETILLQQRGLRLADVSGGAAGRGGESPSHLGKAGAEGHKGTVVMDSFYGWEEEERIDLAVHPQQCRMLLERAKMLYWSGDYRVNLAAYEEAYQLFDILSQRMEYVYRGKRKETYEADISVLMADALEDAGKIFEDVRQETSLRLSLMQQQCDYYGNSTDQVPLTSFQMLCQQFQEALSQLSILEEGYHGYYEKLEKQTVAMDDILQSHSQLQQVIVRAEKDQQTLETQATEQATMIHHYQAMLPHLKQKAQEAVLSVKGKIWKGHGCSMDDFLSALSMCAFMPDSVFMYGIQGAGLLYQDQRMVEDATGNKFRKEFVVHQAKQCEATLEGLAEGYQVLQSGTIAPDDPGADKLLVAQQSFEALLDQFYNQFGPCTQERQAVGDYVQAVVARNNLILAYNQTLVSWMNQKLLQEKSIKDTALLQQSTLQNYHADAPDLTAYMTRLYHNGKMQVLELLYLAQKAYSHWALSKENILYDTFGKTLPNQADAHMISAALTALTKAKIDALEKRRIQAQKFPAKEGSRGICYCISGKELGYVIENLKNYHQFMVELKAPDPETGDQENVFYGLYDVRVHQVKIRLQLKSEKTQTQDKRMIHISMVHNGLEEIKDRSGISFHFRHQPIYLAYRYDYDNGEELLDGCFENEDEEFGRWSPFCQWHFLFNPNYNSWLNYDDIVSIELEFFGTAYGYPEDSAEP